MMSAKLANLALLKIKVTWSKGYDVITFAHDVTNKILSRYSNYIADVAIWPNFGNSTIFMTSYHNLNFIKISLEKTIVLMGAFGSSSIIWNWH